MDSLQRFGPCDPEETEYEIYTDETLIAAERLRSKVVYNLTLIGGAEYSCITFRAQQVERLDENAESENENPQIYLRRWCAGPPELCYGFQHLEIHFFVEIIYTQTTRYSVKVYGKVGKALDPMPLLKHINVMEPPVTPARYRDVRKLLLPKRKLSVFRFFFRSDVENNNVDRFSDPEYLSIRNFYRVASDLVDPNMYNTTEIPTLSTLQWIGKQVDAVGQVLGNIAAGMKKWWVTGLHIG